MAIGFNSPTDTIGYVGNGAAIASLVSKTTGKPVGGFANLGMLSSASFSITNDKVEMQDTMSGTMGVVMSKTVKTTVEVTLNLKSLSPENVARGTSGTVVRDAAATGKIFTDLAYKGKSIVPDGVIASVESIEADGLALVEGEDYMVSDGHIYFPETTSIEDGTEVTVTYSTSATKRVEALTTGDVELCIVFDGRNFAYENTPVKVTMYNVSLSPLSQRQLIGSDFGEMELKGTLQLARHVTGTGLSRYFKEEHVEIA